MTVATRLGLAEWRLLNYLYMLREANRWMLAPMVLANTGVAAFEARVLADTGYATIEPFGDSDDLDDAHLLITNHGISWVLASPHNAVLYALKDRGGRTVPLRRLMAASGVEAPEVYAALDGWGLIEAAGDSPGERHLLLNQPTQSSTARVWLTTAGRRMTP